MTPNIIGCLGDEVLLVLGRALLFYICSPEGLEDVPASIQSRARNAYLYIYTLPIDMNLVKKIPLIITEHEDEVYIDKIPAYGNGNDGADSNNNTENGGGENNNINNGKKGGGLSPVGAFAGGNLGGFLGGKQQQQVLALFLQVQAVQTNINNV